MENPSLSQLLEPFISPFCFSSYFFFLLFKSGCHLLVLFLFCFSVLSLQIYTVGSISQTEITELKDMGIYIFAKSYQIALYRSYNNLYSYKKIYVRGGRREEGSGWGTHVYLWQIHFDIWQNQYNIVKLNKIKFSKKKICECIFPHTLTNTRFYWNYQVSSLKNVFGHVMT